MLPPDIVRQVRRLRITARRAVEGLIGGEYHSVFKGTGIAFEEVREYMPGDDVRSIDWNVTARMGHPFVKRFVEERELTVILAIDCSASHRFGTQRYQKREVAAELGAILAFSAIRNNDRVGLLQFTDRVEHFLPPRKGSRHVLRLIRDMLFFQARHRGTNLSAGLDYLNHVLHHRGIIFLLSDFLDSGFDRAMKQTGRRHDLIAVRIADPRESEMPNVGLLELEDAETGRRLLIDTGNRDVREAHTRAVQQRRQDLRQLVDSARAELIEVSTTGGHLDELIRFFRQREKRLRRG